MIKCVLERCNRQCLQQRRYIQQREWLTCCRAAPGLRTDSPGRLRRPRGRYTRTWHQIANRCWSCGPAHTGRDGAAVSRPLRARHAAPGRHTRTTKHIYYKRETRWYLNESAIFLSWKVICEKRYILKLLSFLTLTGPGGVKI